MFYVTYLKDLIGNNYLGVKISQEIVDIHLSKLKDILSPDDYTLYTSNQQKRDGGSYHLTVINVMEYNKLCDRYKIGEFMNSLEYVFKYEIDDLQFLGVGAAQKNENRSYYIVCKSGKLKDIRDRYELPEQDFHITLGFLYRDVFGVRKNEVMNVPSKFIKLLKEEFLKKENFNFIRYLDNFDGNEDSEIIPISISDTYLKIKCGDFLMDIGFSESENKLSIFTNYNSESEAKRLPLTEFLKFIKNNN